MRWYSSPKMVQRGLLILIGLLVVVPILWVVICSFENQLQYKIGDFFTFIIQHFSLKQYQNVMFHDFEYWGAYWNTVFLTIPTIILAICLASMAAYGLAIVSSRISNRILNLYAILAILPIQMLLVPQLITLSNLHLTGTRAAVILIGSCSPWYIFFMHRLCKRIPTEVIEAARVEGASEWLIFRKIAIPQMKLGIAVFGIIISADLWGMVEEPLVYIQDAAKFPLSVLFHEQGVELSYAGVIVFSMPVIMIFLSGIGAITADDEGGIL